MRPRADRFIVNQKVDKECLLKTASIVKEDIITYTDIRIQSRTTIKS